MEKISKIKIGAYTYDVEYREDSFIGPGGTVLDGLHSFCDKKIIVSKRGADEYIDTVLLHEICHAIVEIYVSPDKQDEHFVEQFSKGLYQVLVDNPLIIKK